VFDHVLVPLDGSELAARILGPVRRLLTARATGGSHVTVLRAIDDRGDPDSGKTERRLVDARRETEGLLAGLVKAGIHTALHLERGDPAEQILAAAESDRPDLLAMTTHGRTGLDRLVRGSVAERVLRRCPVPLLLATARATISTAPEAPFTQRILVPLDGSELAAAILPLVGKLLRAFHAEAVLLRVGPSQRRGDAERAGRLAATLDPAAEVLREAGAHRVERRVAFTHPALGILDALAETRCDLVAMSTHGRSGASRWWLGSVAETVLRECPCPLLVRPARAASA